MASTAESGSSDVLRSERIAGGILPKVLNSFDMVAIFVAIVLFISNSAVITGAGEAAYIYWGLGFITFLIPGAIVTGQLGLMFPGEGSIYVWTNKAFGAFLGFFAGFCAWWPGVLVMIATGDAVVALIQQLNANFLTEPWQQGVVIIAVIAFSFVLSILRFRVTQNFVNIIFLAYGGAILLIGLAGVLWLLSGHHANTDLSFRTGSWGLNRGNFTFYGLVILALLGVEVPLNMGVEINDARAITRYLFWGSAVVIVAYLIGTFGIMMAVPASQQGNPSAIATAVQNGFGAAGPVLGTRVLSTIVYDILQAAVTVIWCVSMVILFIDVIIIRYKYHEVFLRTRLAPDWVFYLCSVVGLCAAAFGVYVTFTGPWTTLLSYTTWILWIGSIAVLSLIIGAVLFFIGQATIKGDVSDEEAIAQATS